MNKDLKAYSILLACSVTGLCLALVTATKVVHLGINFPFSNVIFALCSCPLIDCICELWGKPLAKHAVYIGLMAQVLATIILQLSIIAPSPDFYHQQSAYSHIIGSSKYVALASCIAFTVSQLLDVSIYQRLKQMTQGKWLWLRTNVSSFISQAVDSAIFIAIVFASSQHKFSLFCGSIAVKWIISLFALPLVYFIVNTVNAYLGHQTLAFRHTNEVKI